MGNICEILKDLIQDPVDLGKSGSIRIHTPRPVSYAYAAKYRSTCVIRVSSVCHPCVIRVSYVSYVCRCIAFHFEGGGRHCDTGGIGSVTSSHSTPSPGERSANSILSCRRASPVSAPHRRPRSHHQTQSPVALLLSSKLPTTITTSILSASKFHPTLDLL